MSYGADIPLSNCYNYLFNGNQEPSYFSSDIGAREISRDCQGEIIKGTSLPSNTFFYFFRLTLLIYIFLIIVFDFLLNKLTTLNILPGVSIWIYLVIFS